MSQIVQLQDLGLLPVFLNKPYYSGYCFTVIISYSCYAIMLFSASETKVFSLWPSTHCKRVG